MTKIKNDVDAYEAFQKANKNRKAYLANKAGYPGDIEIYRELLKLKAETIPISTKAISKPVKKTVSNTDIVINNCYLLDNSGSMLGSKFDNAVKAIKDEIEELKKDKLVNYYQSLAYFNEVKWDESIINSVKVPLANFKFPNLGANCMTPLYTTIVDLLEALIKDYNETDKVLVKIFTDGDNNAGNKTKYHAAEIINQAQELGFTITFIGTKDDVRRIINDLNIDKSNTIIHDNTAKGIAEVMNTTTQATKSYTKKVIAGKDVSKGFYAKSDKLF